MSLLEVDSISKRFGGVQAVDGVSLRVEERQIVGLIGPNGAGKTSVFNCLTGLVRIDAGGIRFGPGPVRLDRLPTHRILAAGVARTFQNLRVFRNMSAIENVAVGLHARTGSGAWGALLRTSAHRAQERRILERSADLLRFVRLEREANAPAGCLAYGCQKRLEIARALASEPRLLLLDEPVAGMNPVEKLEIVELIRRIRALGIAVLLIEHDMKVVMPLSDRIVVMDEGRVIAEGLPSEIRSSERVIQAYLGED